MVVIKKKETEEKYLVFHRDLSESSGWWIMAMGNKSEIEENGEKKEIKDNNVYYITDEQLLKDYEFAGNLV